ncbi:hypothetical protein BDV93DRAFT_218155 [Ceratobasidium sp. AG-I]|nr:hypothetical protein BDV93DRAFT_218155 [Ceratobasidium sp. AG-I]
MAPILPYVMSLFHSFNQPDIWVSTASDISEKVRTASEDIDVSSIWAWIVGLFASMGAWFISAWHSALPGAQEGAGEAVDWISKHWKEFSEFLVQPHVRNVLIVWFIVFWIALFIPLTLGFGPKGVLAGSGAAWFQSAIYGAFTPAGGVFAVLTSIGMMGIAYPPAVILAVVLASGAAAIAWGVQG